VQLQTWRPFVHVPLNAKGLLGLEHKRKGRTFWVAVGLAPIFVVTVLVELHTLYLEILSGRENPLVMLLGDLLFILWNCAPLLLALALVSASRHSGPVKHFAAYGFAVGAAAAVLYWHIVWAFNIGKTATSSSTSGIVFAILPAWALRGGAVAAVPAGIVGFFWKRHFASRSTHRDAE
jgi:hypothetical protein